MAIKMQKLLTGALVAPVMATDLHDRNEATYLIEYRTRGVRILIAASDYDEAVYFAEWVANIHSANNAADCTIFVRRQIRHSNKQFDRWLVAAISYTGGEIHRWEGQG